MLCPQCGKQIPDISTSCAHCGAAIGSSGASTPPSGFPPKPSAAPLTMSDPRVTGLIARVKAILFTPKAEWPVIANEAATPRALYLGYVAPLALIGVIAMFIGAVVIGIDLPILGHLRVGVLSGLASAILMYAMAFAGVFILAWIVDALAPTFGGQRDSLRALKVVAYSYTPAWIAGALNVAPSLSLLGVIAGLYGLYLMYLGLPVLMKSPQEKAVAYSAVVVGCAIVLFVIIGALTTCVGGYGTGPMIR